VENFHVFPTIYLQRRKGPAVPKETCKRRTGRKSLVDTFFQTHNNARDQLFRTLPSGKTETRWREHRVYWFPTFVCWCPICDGHNSSFWSRWWLRFAHGIRTGRVVKCRKSSEELNPRIKGCKFGGAWRMSPKPTKPRKSTRRAYLALPNSMSSPWRATGRALLGGHKRYLVPFPSE